ncbi:MAG TPA: D-aminoacyl-tRNA deacylase [Gaiellales bacterium]|nr:D-aminoacyl-tRNA deacylase [Gaiellales bacterium]
MIGAPVRTLVQRVARASVTVDGKPVAAIGRGLLALVAAGRDDGPGDVAWTSSKLARLRIFPGADGRMARSIGEVAGSLLLVPQFTLYGDVSRGTRPSFDGAADATRGASLLDDLADALERLDVPVERGLFGADMQVDLRNDGPVTIWLESP